VKILLSLVLMLGVAHAEDPARLVVTLRGKFKIAALDAAAKPVLKEVLESLPNTEIQWGGKPRGDGWFTLDAKVENGSCGILRGPIPCMIVRVGPIDGPGVLSIAALENDHTPAELRKAYETAIHQGFAMLAHKTRQMAEGDDVPAEITVPTTGLDAAQLKVLTDQVLPCAARLAKPQAQRTDVQPSRVVLTVTGRAARGAEETWLAQLTKRLENLDKECKLARTPLKDRIVEVRRLGRTITVDLARP
jgi:hypothetical protein